MNAKRVISILVLGAVALATSGLAAADDYPTNPIRLVVPWPPGGGTDVFARLIGHQMSEDWKTSVVVDNRAGAAGNIGAEIVAKAPADGYTIMLATITIATAPSMYKSLGFDPIRDFAPITLVAGVPHVLVVNSALPVHDVQELIALAKREPGKLNYASAGVGSPFHLAAELFKLLSGTDIVHVPYQGGGPAVTAVLSNQVQLAFANMVAVLPQVRAGKLRALGVTSARRSPSAPDTPTLAESGLPGYDFTSWFGFFAPARTPKHVVMRLNHEIVATLKRGEIKNKLTVQGADIVGNSSEEFTRYVASETKKWARVIKQAGIKAN